MPNLGYAIYFHDEAKAHSLARDDALFLPPD